MFATFISITLSLLILPSQKPSHSLYLPTRKSLYTIKMGGANREGMFEDCTVFLASGNFLLTVLSSRRQGQASEAS